MDDIAIGEGDHNERIKRPVLTVIATYLMYLPFCNYGTQVILTHCAQKSYIYYCVDSLLDEVDLFFT